MSSYRGRWLVVLCYVIWGACVLYVIACLVAPSVVGSTGCELEAGSSVFGEPSRSWFPPGTTCTYQLPGYGLYETNPSPVRLVVVAAALAGFPLTRYLSGLLRSPSAATF